MPRNYSIKDTIKMEKDKILKGNYSKHNETPVVNQNDTVIIEEPVPKTMNIIETDNVSNAPQPKTISKNKNWFSKIFGW